MELTREPWGFADTLVLSPASVSPPLVHHLKARRTGSSSSSGKIDFEEVSDDIARRGAVAVLRWAIEKGFIKVRHSWSSVRSGPELTWWSPLCLRRISSSYLATCCLLPLLLGQ